MINDENRLKEGGDKPDFVFRQGHILRKKELRNKVHFARRAKKPLHEQGREEPPFVDADEITNDAKSISGGSSKSSSLSLCLPRKPTLKSPITTTRLTNARSLHWHTIA